MQFIEQGAFTAVAAIRFPDTDSGSIHILGDMERAGFAVQTHGSWFMTQHALSSLIIGQEMMDPVSLIEPPDDMANIQVCDMSNYVLLLYLEDQGWDWLPLPPKKDRAEKYIVVHADGKLDDCVLYGGFRRSYFEIAGLCSQSPHELRSVGIQAIAQFEDDVFYKNMLQLITEPGDRPLELEDADKDNKELVDQAGNDESGVSDSDRSAAAATPLGEPVLDSDVVGAVVEPEILESELPPLPPPLPSPEPPAELPPETEPPAELPPPASAPRAESPGRIMDIGLRTTREMNEWVADRMKLTSARRRGKHVLTWGAFLMTYKPASDSWQASCRWHKLNERSGCKKTVKAGPLKEDHYSAIRILKYWCMRAQAHNRQRLHLWIWDPLTMDMADIPPDAVLDANVPTTEPPPIIFTDAQLDTADLRGVDPMTLFAPPGGGGDGADDDGDGRAGRPPKRRRTAAAKASSAAAKAKAVSKAKAKPAAKAKAAARPASSSSSGGGSSSSSSSSSSSKGSSGGVPDTTSGSD